MKTNKIAVPNFTDSDIQQMVQAVIDDDPQAIEIKDSLAISLKQLTNNEIGRINYPIINNIYKQTGLSQQDFASVIGVSVHKLQAWEQGKDKPIGAEAKLIQLLNKKPELINEII